MTILGKHTINETRDALKVADYRFRETYKVLNALPNIPEDLRVDAKALAEKWAKARMSISADLIAKAILTFPVSLSPDIIPAEDDYQKVIAFTQFGENVKGSLQDITERTNKLSDKKISYNEQPDQNSPDFDLGTFQELDKVIKAGEGGAKDAGKAAGEFASSGTGIAIIAGVSVVGTLAAIAYFKK